MIELRRPPSSPARRSPFAAARLARRLTVEEAARRAGLPQEQVEWLEEARVYRFASPGEALAAAVVYASALGIDPREARALAGLPVARRGLGRSARRRLLVLAVVALAAAGLAGALALPERTSRAAEPAHVAAAAAPEQLPERFEISVEVLNGSGDINWTRQIASRIGALAYRIEHVGRADRFDYRQTAVYYEPGGEQNAIRLARELGVVTKPLPGGEDPNRLVVVVGPRRGPTQ